MPVIREIHARQVLDSRGNPTVEVQVLLAEGALGRAIVPSGASTGKSEALEIRDQDPKRYCGKGVLRAVEKVEREIAPALRGMDAKDQSAIDARLVALDGTPNKSRLGANAVLGVSLAVAHAAARAAGIPLYRYLGGTGAAELPLPMVNILSGGLHGGGNLDFQDYMVIPLRARRYSEALEDAVSIYRAMKDVLKARGAFEAGVADEGGYAPRLRSNDEGFELMVEAFERAGFRPGEDAAIAVDVAASQFHDGSRYRIAAGNLDLDSGALVGLLERCVERYPILSIEDGLDEEDWAGWKALTSSLGTRCQLIGDDLFVTNSARLRRAWQEKAGNAVLVKMNQIGTLTQTLDLVRLAREHNYRTIVSARSGETEDDSLAHLVVGLGASQVKIGSVTRSERLAKYNTLLRIEEELGRRAVYRGAQVFQGIAGGFHETHRPSDSLLSEEG